VISVADPEMRHGRKSASRRFDGHKLDVMTDEATELVLAVAVRAGNAADQDGTLPLLEKVQKMAGVEVETLLGDMAHSDPELREATEEVGVDLVAKVPPVTNAGRFPKTDFSIDTAAASVTCPAGVTTTEAKREKDHKGRPGLRFVFPISACAACALRAECVKGDTAGRSVFVSRHEDRMAAARAAEKDPQTKALLRRRSKVERKIDHLQDLGMRKARLPIEGGARPPSRRCSPPRSPTSRASASSARSPPPRRSPPLPEEGDPMTKSPRSVARRASSGLITSPSLVPFASRSAQGSAIPDRAQVATMPTCCSLT